jgi:uncharacterized RDD family membrane protein YckC
LAYSVEKLCFEKSDDSICELGSHSQKRIAGDDGLEIKDDEFDYSAYSLSELRDVEAHIDAQNYPKNHANLQRAIANYPKPEQPIAETKSKYASIWQRLGAYWLDVLILFPIVALGIWGGEQSQLFSAYYFVPGVLFGLWYHVYLVKRYGGTAGKLIMGIKIAKLEGEPVGYREAVLRYSVLFALATINQVAFIQTTMGMSDADYYAFDWQERILRIQELAPSWLESITLLTNIWVWSEFVVMLTNKKRRAIHDFIAGTVVVRADSD